MMRIELEELQRQARISEVRVLALAPALYTLRVTIGVREFVVIEQGRGITRPSVEALKALLARCRVERWRLVHESAYDEMVGQPPKSGGNLMEVPLGNNRLGGNQLGSNASGSASSSSLQ